ncbi:Fe-S cluster assembly sulfur transfer protein SufU [Cephaloticoccus primus]|uniref:Fe-S cluster assembly sulfur transfer protein SufU n=1 Tax=Cephaloticoccus primus TaxID=1548207 RepID=UPI0009EDF716|nr:SUF system NifU family Fe-S cluster assembly protein [Cephaloticoccus primus]
MSELSDLYQQVILDHNRRPRNRGKLPTANRVARGDNPSCGDQCCVYIRLDGERITDLSFDGSGCAISQASASLMTTQLKGKTAAEAQALFDEFKKIVTTGEAPEEMSDVAAFAGVSAFPARIKCATLGWHAALGALAAEPAGPAGSTNSASADASANPASAQPAASAAGAEDFGLSITTETHLD